MPLGCLVFSPGRVRFGRTLPGRALFLGLLLCWGGCVLKGLEKKTQQTQTVENPGDVIALEGSSATSLSTQMAENSGDTTSSTTQAVKSPVSIEASEGSKVTSINLTFLGKSAGWILLPILGWVFLRSRVTVRALDRVLGALEDVDEGDDWRKKNSHAFSMLVGIKRSVQRKGVAFPMWGSGTATDPPEKLIRKRLRKVK